MNKCVSGSINIDLNVISMLVEIEVDNLTLTSFSFIFFYTGFHIPVQMRYFDE